MSSFHQIESYRYLSEDRDLVSSSVLLDLAKPMEATVLPGRDSSRASGNRYSKVVAVLGVMLQERLGAAVVVEKEREELRERF